MLARFELEQIQQIQWKIPTAPPQKQTRIALSFHVGQFEHLTDRDCNTIANRQHCCMSAGNTGFYTELLSRGETNPWTHVNESWKQMSYSRKVLGKFFSDRVCFCGCRLFLNFARACTHFPKRSKASCHSQSMCPKNLVRKAATTFKSISVGGIFDA